jgi:hypothetical protein
VGDVDRHYGFAAQGDHHAEASGGDEVDGGDAEAGGQYAVEGRGRASALDVAEHADADFFVAGTADGVSDQVGDGIGAAVFFQLGGKLHAFSDYNNREVLALLFPRGYELADVRDGERNFGNQNHVSAASDAGFESDPSAVPSHDFDHHHAMMRGGGGVNFVERVGDGVQRRVEPERDLGGGKIVVDGLGHADDFQSLLEKLVSDFLRAVATNADDGVDAQLVRVGDDLSGNVARDLVAVDHAFVVKRIAAVGGAEDGASTGQNARNFLERKFESFFRPDEAVEAVRDADDFPAVAQDGGFRSGADDGVETGSVPASGGDANAFDVRHEFVGGLSLSSLLVFREADGGVTPIIPSG